MNPPKISKSGGGLPSRVVLHGVEGIGKTSFGAYAPAPLFGMSRGETGLLTLIDNGRVPPIDHFEEWKTWEHAMGDLNYFLSKRDFQAESKCLVIDTANGLERLCHESVCSNQYEGNWEKFLAYGKGPEVALKPWSEFINLLDRIRETRRIGVILLCHTRVKRFQNPDGDDFDRYTPDMNEKTWGITHKWADVVLFANYKTTVKKDFGALKAKAKSDAGRFLFTVRTPAFDAKNRNGLPISISMGHKPQDAWLNFAGAMQKARQTGIQAEVLEPEDEPGPDDSKSTPKAADPKPATKPEIKPEHQPKAPTFEETPGCLSVDQQKWIYKHLSANPEYSKAILKVFGFDRWGLVPVKFADLAGLVVKNKISRDVLLEITGGFIFKELPDADLQAVTNDIQRRFEARKAS